MGLRDLENIKTNAPQPVNIRMVDFRQKSHFGWSHWVLLWKEKLKLVHTPCCKPESLKEFFPCKFKLKNILKTRLTVANGCTK